MEYRTKAAVKIIAGLTKSEAFELFKIVDGLQELFGKGGVRLYTADKETAITFACESVDEWIANGKLEVPPYLKDSLYSFLKLMVSERAQEDELLYEYNRALCPLIHYDLFKADA